MKKLILCFFSVFLFAPGAFGADGAVSRVLPSLDNGGDANAGVDTGRTVSRVATRVVEAGQVEKNSKSTESLSTAPVRSAVSRVFSGAPEVKKDKPQQVATGVIARSGLKSNSAARSNLSEALNTVGRNKRVSDASINANPTVRRAGVILRPSTAEVGGRAIIGDTGMQTGSNIDEQVRSVHSRAAKEVTAESIAEATARLEQTAELNKSCQEQYNDCMDQFCAVIDANQKRCSCSSNLNQYAKVEEAVKDANNQLNAVAQRIRYVGLSADEIRAILTETEAEEALSGTTDTSETRNMLEQIEALIRDPVSNTATFSESDGLGLDMNLDFSSESVDIFNLDFLGAGNTGSFSNLRGAELYRAAKKRCNTVLNQCKEAGSTVAQITGNYDLAIDKDCIAYANGLKKMNETLISNVGSANRMLQKARLAVLQNKNKYDAKGCIGALEACMTDEMVCGEKYFKCVDPTKIYIDENGKVVLGQRTADILDFMTNYNNANIDKVFLEDTEDVTINESNCKAVSSSGTSKGESSSDTSKGDGKCTAKYLVQKIGTGQKVTDGGLCRAVLDKCQMYTYDASGKYMPYNDIVVNYVQRAMVNIRAAQSKIISEYASSCIVDVADCYNEQVTQVNTWSSSASVASIQRVLAGACRNVALTCAYAVFMDANKEICYTDDAGQQQCSEELTLNTPGDYVKAISEMFYQSLLCPENSMYKASGKDAETTDGEKAKYVNSHCKCNTDYEVWGSSCLRVCNASSEERDSYGVCQCKVGYQSVNGVCSQIPASTGE